MGQTRQPHRRRGFAGSAPRAVTTALGFLGLVALVAGGSAASVAAADTGVSVVDFAFEPAEVTIALGDSVTWTVTRAEDPHTVSPIDSPGAFETSSFLREGDRFAVTFVQPGTYRYLCMIHPEDMEGIVVVQAAHPTAGPTAPPTLSGSPAAVPASPTPPPSPKSRTSPAADSPSLDGSLPPALVLPVVLLGGAVALGGAWLVVRRHVGRR